MTACAAVRLELGAYVLGGLTPVERAAVDRHLLDCPTCAAELSEIEDLPVLLSQLGAAEVASLPASGDRTAASADRATAGDELASRRLRKALRTAAVAAAGAAAGIVALLLATSHAAPAPSFSNDAGRVRMSVAVANQPGGTALTVDVRGLPENEHCTLAALDRSGSREVVGRWTASYAGEARVVEASSFSASQLASLTLLGSDGQSLVNVTTD